MRRRLARRSTWRARSPSRGTPRRREQRAAVLRAAAELIEADRAELVARCVAETGRTDRRQPRRGARGRGSIALLRRGMRARARGADGAAGTDRRAQRAQLIGRGVFVCMSPWNFPLAIFMGQVAAALAAGNTAIAKPAEQGSLVAARAVALLERAGVPAGRAAVPARRRPRARRRAARAIRASRASCSRAPWRRRGRSTRRSRRARGRSRR